MASRWQLCARLPIYFFPLLFVAAFLGSVVAAPRQLPVRRVPANFAKKQDSKGFTWYPYSSYGNLHGSSSSYGFYDAGLLMVNGSQFAPTQKMMSPDGNQYFFSNNLNGIQVNRHITMMLSRSVSRFTDSFLNSSTAPKTIEIKLYTRLRYNGATVLTDSGRTFSGKFRDDDLGLAAKSTNSSTPGVIMYLVGKRAKQRPTIQIANNQTYTSTYRLTIQPRETVTLVHGYGQRRWATMDAKAIKKEFDVFRSRDFLKDVDRDVRKTFVNSSSSAGSLEGQPLLHELIELTEFWDVERGQTDVLVLDEDTQVNGTLRGGPLLVKTELGEVELPLDVVASVTGGDDQGRVFLRSGEVLVGPIQSKEVLTLSTELGLEMKVDPQQVKLIGTRLGEDDGKSLDDVGALIQTTSGNRLCVPADAEFKLQVITAWGPMEIPVTDIRQLVARQDPQPLFRLVTKDQSELDVMLRGASWTVQTTRFGEIELAPAEILDIVNPHVVPADELDDDEELPAVYLRGDNRLTGRFSHDELTFITLAGETIIKTSDIYQLDLVDLDRTSFRLRLHSGTQLVGRPAATTLQLAAMGRTWNIRPDQIVSVEQPEIVELEKDPIPTVEVPVPKVGRDADSAADDGRADEPKKPDPFGKPPKDPFAPGPKLPADPFERDPFGDPNTPPADDPFSNRP